MSRYPGIREAPDITLQGKRQFSERIRRAARITVALWRRRRAQAAAHGCPAVDAHRLYGEVERWDRELQLVDSLGPEDIEELEKLA